MAQALGNYLHLNANTTGVQVKKEPGELFLVTINKLGALSNLLTLYDALDASDATKMIANIDTTVALGSLFYEVVTKVGLFAVLANGTAADLTISFA